MALVCADITLYGLDPIEEHTRRQQTYKNEDSRSNPSQLEPNALWQECCLQRFWLQQEIHTHATRLVQKAAYKVEKSFPQGLPRLPEVDCEALQKPAPPPPIAKPYYTS